MSPCASHHPNRITPALPPPCQVPSCSFPRQTRMFVLFQTHPILLLCAGLFQGSSSSAPLAAQPKEPGRFYSTSAPGAELIPAELPDLSLLPESFPCSANPKAMIRFFMGQSSREVCCRRNFLLSPSVQQPWRESQISPLVPLLGSPAWSHPHPPSSSRSSPS